MALTGVPELGGWRVTPSPTPAGTTPPELTITYATDDFATALALANRIGEAAEAADHHPDLTVSYGRLTVGMHSHDVRGTWTPGTVRGVPHASGVGAATGYPGVVLATPAATEHPAAQIADVPAQLLVSVDLPDHWDRLDAFEGAGYRRVPGVVALEDDDAVRPAFVYELVPDAVPPSA